MNQLYDVLAVNIKTKVVRILSQKKTLPHAEAIVHMVIMRRGVEEEFYVEVPTGKYEEGEIYGRSLSK